MEMTVQGKQIDIGDALRTHVTDKLSDIDQKYFNHATDATVTFSREGHGSGLFRVHISMRVGKNIMVITEATENDPYLAFDTASDKAAKRLRRYKRQLRDHHARRQKTPEEELMKARYYTLALNGGAEAMEQDNEEILEDHDDDVPQGDDPVVVAEITTEIETLSVSDAVMRMELADRNALLFRDAKTNRLNMVYLRNDGNVGWVDPQEH
ncbi:MAG: ribosome-associated translation inhibitor RaiA [Rhodospirillales bacterium]|nr:ribosome-associated translation inhibitor RaiA [Alphaproteobacteria bacterium]MCB1841019.1 ribosome-associated translation inhibitor RaiA [Alphaproteobacteria bacterium]MCB9977852.1 ribosome-associated translation inhibitor RaiA [Rhodospirillales bacterium]